jgi:hypothetical protein
MAGEWRQREFLAKAKEAEDQARMALSEANKASWLQLAAGYHHLASCQDPPKT